MTEVFSIYQIPYKSGGPKEINLLYSPEEFLETFKDWRIVHFFMGEVIRHEGELHTGLAHTCNSICWSKAGTRSKSLLNFFITFYIIEVR